MKEYNKPSSLTIVQYANMVSIGIFSFALVIEVYKHGFDLIRVLNIINFITAWIIFVNIRKVQGFIKRISYVQAIENAKQPLKEFMLKNTRKEDLKLFLDISKEKPQKPEDVSMTTLIPSFMISEIKTAFEIVFIIYLPFLVIDFVVASILMSMGMMMIPPMFISLPFKLMLFVLADGWELLTKALIQSYKF